MLKILLFLLISNSIALWATDYMILNSIKKPVFIIKAVLKNSEEDDFLYSSFPELAANKNTPLKIVTLNDLPLLNEERIIEFFPENVSDEKAKLFFQISQKIPQIKHLKITGGKNLNFLKSYNFSSIEIVSFKGSSIDFLCKKTVQKLIIKHSPNLNDKIIPCLKSLPLKHLEIDRSVKITDFSFLRDLKLEVLKIFTGKNFQKEYLPHSELRILHITAGTVFSFLLSEQQIKNLNELVLTNVSIDEKFYHLLSGSTIKQLALQKVYVANDAALFNSIGTMKCLKNFYCVGIYGQPGYTISASESSFMPNSLITLVCDNRIFSTVKNVTSLSELKYLKIIKIMNTNVSDIQKIKQLNKLNLKGLFLCRYPASEIKNIQLLFPVNQSHHFRFSTDRR